MLDGSKNSLVEINCVPIPKGPNNPAGNAWIAEETVLKKVADARRQHDVKQGRYWKVINSQVKNHVHQPVGYKILPSGPPCYPLCDLDSGQGGRSAFAQCHMWATPYHSRELYAAGEFSNQADGHTDGVATYSQMHADDSLVDCDLVTWYTFGATHIVRPEDWPVMPVETTGFRLLPVGFFAGSPAIDVPAPVAQKCNGAAHCSNHV